jgi:5-methylcytosine-specific restriction endonuclease McrA
MARTKAYSDQRADWYRLYRSLHSHIAVDRVTTWRKENPEKHAANHAKRRAAKRNACPPWVDHAAIEAIYAEAARLTAETGIPHQVDHIIPLMGKNVCGLHVPWNLRAIPAIENQRKGNKLEDNPPR